VIHVQPEDGHYQAPKHVVVLYVIIIIIYCISLHHVVVLDSKLTPLLFLEFKYGNNFTRVGLKPCAKPIAYTGFILEKQIVAHPVQ